MRAIISPQFLRCGITELIYQQQANPLNTYLFSKPSFASPQPLAASSGLTIPLQISLSEIKLSAFIILVFHKQKGLTLVFRNDPLESLKVSSTFDSIPFVRDYLQKEIEMQLRTLMMEQLPAIIHQLSLTLWCSEHIPQGYSEMAAQDTKEQEVPVDPFASPPQDAVDARGNVLDANEISSLSLDGGSEIHSLFSQKNLLRLAALSDSHRTLSLFTPSIRDAVFRAWAGTSERGDSAGSSTPATPGLIRSHSAMGQTSTTYSFGSRTPDDGNGTMPSRPSLVSLNTATTGLHLGAGRHSRSHANRKKKTRVVNLRKPKTADDLVSESGDSETSSATPASEPIMGTRPILEEPEDNVISPPHSPSGRVRFRASSIDLGDSPRKLKLPTTSRSINLSSMTVPEQAILDPIASIEREDINATVPTFSRHGRPSPNRVSYPIEKFSTMGTSTSNPSPIIRQLSPAPTLSESTSAVGGILEQAWILKMAGEIARRAQDEKAAQAGFWSAHNSNSGREDTPPPAYQPAA
jgi:distribution and morphology protein 34